MFPPEVDAVLNMKHYVDKRLDRAFVRYPSCPHANKKGYVQRARCIVWLTGRKIPPGHVVHHVDGNKYNDGPFNLAVLSNSEHTAHHMTGRPLPEKVRKAFLAASVGNTWAKGKPWTAERKAKLSARKRQQWADPNGPYVTQWDRKRVQGRWTRDA